MSREVLATALVLVIAGCASAPTQYYRLLPSDSRGADLTAQGTQIMLDSLTVPALVDRMQLVVAASATQVRLLQHERWAVPLRDQIADVLVADLRADLKTDDAGCISQSDGARPLRLSVEIDRFEATLKGFAMIDARWQVRGGVGSPTNGSATARQPLTGDSPDNIVLAWSEALSNLSAQIAESVYKQMGATR